MPIEINQVTTANLVLVDFEALNDEQSLLRFFKGAKSFVSTEPQIDGSISLDMQADRVSVVRRIDNTTIIKRDYPSFIRDLDRLAEVAELVISNTSKSRETYAFGFNVEAACTQRSDPHTSRYLAEKFFNLQGLVKEGFQDFGSASWNLEFSERDKRWRVSVRRLENALDSPNLFVTLNSHHEAQALPNKRAIRNGLRDTWNGIPKFIDKLEQAS